MGVWMYKGKPYDFGELKPRLQRVKRTLPPILANEAVNFIKDRFKEQGWRDKRFEKWTNRKPGAKRPGRALLVNTGHLRNSIRTIKATFRETSVGTNVPYAAAHNMGANQTVRVRAHTRRVNSTVRVGQSNLATRRTSNRTRKVQTGTVAVKAHNRKMNLPQRQFMGNSRYFENEILVPAINGEVMKIFK